MIRLVLWSLPPLAACILLACGGDDAPADRSSEGETSVSSSVEGPGGSVTEDPGSGTVDPGGSSRVEPGGSGTERPGSSTEGPGSGTAGPSSGTEGPGSGSGVEAGATVRIVEIVSGPAAALLPGEEVTIRAEVEAEGEGELEWNWQAPEGWTVTGEGAERVLRAPDVFGVREVLRVEARLGAAVDVVSVPIGTVESRDPVIRSVVALPTRVAAGESSVVTVEALHPLERPLSVAWSVDDPAWSVVADGMQATVTAPEEGDSRVLVTVRVEDDLEGVAESSVALESEAVAPPVITGLEASREVVILGRFAELEVEAFEPTGRDLQWTWRSSNDAWSVEADGPRARLQAPMTLSSETEVSVEVSRAGGGPARVATQVLRTQTPSGTRSQVLGSTENRVGSLSGAPADGRTRGTFFVQLLDEDGEAIPHVVPVLEDLENRLRFGPCSRTDGEGIANCVAVFESAGSAAIAIEEPARSAGFAFLSQIGSSSCDPERRPFGTAVDRASSTRFNAVLICHPEHLRNLFARDGSATNDFHARVVADLDMAGLDVSGFFLSFRGTFFGGGYTISNLLMPAQPFLIIETEGQLAGIRLVDPQGDAGSGVFGALRGRASFVDVVLTEEGPDNWQGLAASVGPEGVLSHVRLQGDVRMDAVASAAIAGLLDGRIHRASVEGVIQGPGGPGGLGVAGLVWNNEGEVVQSFLHADVEGPGPVGGLFRDTGEARDVWALGELTGASVAPLGLVRVNPPPESAGRVWTAMRLQGSEENWSLVPDRLTPGLDSSGLYWDEDVQSGGTPVAGVGRALPTAAFALEESFPHFDFDRVWMLTEAPDGVIRPQLRWQFEPWPYDWDPEASSP